MRGAECYIESFIKTEFCLQSKIIRQHLEVLCCGREYVLRCPDSRYQETQKLDFSAKPAKNILKKPVKCYHFVYLLSNYLFPQKMIRQEDEKLKERNMR